ncbi:MAG: peroxidase family protein [Xenococcaceae cyanobacterium]
MIALNKIGITLTIFTILESTTSLPSIAAEFRSIDGANNNLKQLDWGKSDTSLIRLTSPDYDDGLYLLKNTGSNGNYLSSPRQISNAISAQSKSVKNKVEASDWLWQWGQFLDHDLSLTEIGHTEKFNISIPKGDKFFDPFNTGTATMGFHRSSSFGVDSNGVRQQHNDITTYIDASNVYGSDEKQAKALRTLDGTGKLKTSHSNNGDVLLPKNRQGFFVAGDERANEQVGLTAAHTLFVREHNRLAEQISAKLAAKTPELVKKFHQSGLEQDDFIYETTRKIVGAKIQAITYNEFLPILLGDFSPNPDSLTYDSSINPSISNEFSTAAFRVGHTLLSSKIQLANDYGSQGSINLKNAFFNPYFIQENGIDYLLLGLASQEAQAVDTLLIDNVRNFLFGIPGGGGFDLASLNIQRGRDHGLGGLNHVRRELGLEAYVDFVSLTGGDTQLAKALSNVYDSVEDVDLWVGGLAEVEINGGLVGETFSTIIRDQFTRLAAGDRFFFAHDLHLNSLENIFALDLANTKLSNIIRQNSSITTIQDHAFLVEKTRSTPEPSGLISLLGLGILLTGSQLITAKN